MQWNMLETKDVQKLFKNLFEIEIDIIYKGIIKKTYLILNEQGLK